MSAVLIERLGEEAILAFDEMAWVEPRYSKEEVNAAGKILVAAGHVDWEKEWKDEDWLRYADALSAINNWRGCHAYPLNTFQVNLRRTGRRYDPNVVVAQRIKRLFSIGHKLDRFPKMKLTQMQDLGGCRAIVNTAATVKAISAYYQRDSNIKHELSTVDDYLATPKESGYRGIHLVYRYFSDKPAKEIYNKLKIEMQLRSKYQHAWATTVETVGTFSGQALKSSLGTDEWQRFFSLMGSAIALREGEPLVPGTPTNKRELIAELEEYARTLRVADRLREYANTLQNLGRTVSDKDHYFLLELDPAEGKLQVSGFTAAESQEAANKYAQAEQRVRE